MRARLGSIALTLAVAGCMGSPVGEAELPLVGDGVCASLDQIDEACPADAAWRTHGKYVSCVAHYLNRRVERGDLDEDQKGALVALAAQSEVGKVAGADGPSFAGAIGDADDDGVADGCEGRAGIGRDPADPRPGGLLRPVQY